MLTVMAIHSRVIWGLITSPPIPPCDKTGRWSEQVCGAWISWLYPGSLQLVHPCHPQNPSQCTPYTGSAVCHTWCWDIHMSWGEVCHSWKNQELVWNYPLHLLLGFSRKNHLQISQILESRKAMRIERNRRTSVKPQGMGFYNITVLSDSD